MSIDVPAEPAAPFRIRLEPGGLCIPSLPGRTVLASALAAAVPMRSACRAGTCRACIARLRSGRIAQAIDWPGLTPEEKAEGYILPCVSHARSDLVLELPDAAGHWW